MSTVYHDVGFVHLHVHSSYSLLEGALTIGKLADLAKADKQPALAITDTNNLFGALEFSEKLSGVGIQPIIGVQISLAYDDDAGVRGSGLFPSIVLLAQNEKGYGNLLCLVSTAALSIEADSLPHITPRQLEARSEGLIALTGGPHGPIDTALRNGQSGKAAERLQELARLFGDRLYVEIQRHGLSDINRVEARLIDLAYENALPLVATNEPYFATESDYDAHDALLAIAEGRLLSEEDRRRLTREHRFKTRRDMQRLFKDLPEALASTVEIAMRCSFHSPKRKPILPRFTAPSGESVDETTTLKEQAHAGLRNRFLQHELAPGLTQEDYIQRLDFELNVIDRMQYPGYFLIVADFIAWAKAQGIPVGPGRGSGAGSLVAYALTITDIDPLRFGLLFERFLNPERVSMPDFDIDFCQDRREEVIAYVRQRYGEDKVAQIITFGTLQARGVLRDVGRVLEMPYGQVDKLTKLVPQNPANPVTLAQAIAGEQRLREAARDEPTVEQLLTIAQKLEGLHRHASTHAAGIVIGDRPLEELVPLVRDAKTGMRVSQFNMKWVEAAGLVKFDFLGLKTLTVLTAAVELVARKGIAIDLSALPFDDAATYAMLQRGETVGVFQLESAGMRKALVEMNADRFEDLIALVALYRPGPMANIPTYCARKNGKEKADYLHPNLEAILTETHGIIVYQEQVMQAAQLLAGYSLGDADLLRRAMGKKIKSEMDAQRDRFVKGATERGLTKDLANEIFDLLAKFADYGFNKSHAAAYALVAYQTAYLKANHPVEFLAASMTLDMDNTDKLAEFRREAQRLGITVHAPCIQTSGVVFDVYEGSIRYALAAIKGVGRQAVEALIEAREQTGSFASLSDLSHRIDPRHVNRRTLENLVAAGALDRLDVERARAHAAVDVILAVAQRQKSRALDGQNELFGGGAAEPFRLPPHTPWLPAVRLQKEYDAVGFFLSGHPLDDYGPLLKKLRVQPWMEFARAVRRGEAVGKLAAVVLDRTERRTKSGSKMGIVNLSDQTGHFEAIIFAEGLQTYRDMLEPGRVLLLSLQASHEGDDIRARILQAEKLDEAAARHQAGLRITIVNENAIASVKSHLVKHSGKGEKGEVCFIVPLDGGQREVDIRLPGTYAATPHLAHTLRIVPGVAEVELV